MEATANFTQTYNTVRQCQERLYIVAMLLHYLRCCCSNCIRALWFSPLPLSHPP